MKNELNCWHIRNTISKLLVSWIKFSKCENVRFCELEITLLSSRFQFGISFWAFPNEYGFCNHLYRDLFIQFSPLTFVWWCILYCHCNNNVLLKIQRARHYNHCHEYTISHCNNLCLFRVFYANNMKYLSVNPISIGSQTIRRIRKFFFFFYERKKIAWEESSWLFIALNLFSLIEKNLVFFGFWNNWN